MYQTILPSIHISLIGVSTPHLNCVTSAVLLFSFFGELMLLLVSGGNLFILKSYNLRSLSALQEDSVLCYYFIPELLDVLQFLSLFLLLCNPPPFGFFLCFDLHLSSYFLSYVLYITDLHYLFQINQKVLLCNNLKLELRFVMILNP